jgi:hypothetical protein
MGKEEGRSSISNARSYREMGEYWDTHDAGEMWEQTEPAELEVDLRQERVYYPVGRSLSDRIAEIAREQGISAETLLNLWVQEKVLRLSRSS